MRTMRVLCVLLMLFGVATFALGFSIMYKLPDLPQWIVAVQVLMVPPSDPKAALGGLLICLMGLAPFVVGFITFSTFRR